MDNLLRDTFSSFEGEIPMSDWFAIEEKLNNKKRFAWIWWAALPLLLVAGLSIYSLLIKKDSNTFTKKITVQKEKTTYDLIVKKDATNDKIVSQSFNSTNNIKTKTVTSFAKNNIYKLNKDSKIEITEANTAITNNPFESIYLISKSLGNIWKLSLPIVEKIKELELPKPNNKKPSRFSYEFGINVSPAMGIDAIKQNKNNWINHNYFSSIANSASFGSGFNNGVHGQVNIGKHWYIRQGIYSTTYSVNNDFNYTITDFPNVIVGRGITGYNPLNPSDYLHIQKISKASIKYISIPLLAGNRTYINKKWGIESKVGVNVSKLWCASGQTVNPTYLNLEDINSNNSIKKWNSSLSISTGVFIKTNNNLIFTVEPNFSTLLSSARVKDYPVKTRYYNYGLNVNLNYSIGGSKK